MGYYLRFILLTIVTKIAINSSVSFINGRSLSSPTIFASTSTPLHK